MAVVKFKLSYLNSLMGEELSKELLEEACFSYGMEVENIDENLTLDITLQRPDMLSTEGFARALKGYLGLEMGLKKYNYQDSNIDLVINDNVKKIRPFINAAVIKNVNLSLDSIESLINAQEKRHLTYGRKREKAAIGLYEFDKIVHPIYYRTADKTTKFIPLDSDTSLTLEEVLVKHPKGITYRHLFNNLDELLVLEDSKNNILSMPPIINSNKVGKITENTKNIFIEVTGTTKTAVDYMLQLITTDILEIGGELYRVNVRDGNNLIKTPEFCEKKLELDKEYVKKVLNLDLTNSQLIGLLDKMRFNSKINKTNKLEVVIPVYRGDIFHQIDLVEDIAIAYGYKNFKPKIPNSSTFGKEDQLSKHSDSIKEICASLGLIEVRSDILTNCNDQYKKMNISQDNGHILLKNSSNNLKDIARVKILPQLLNVISNNKRKELPINIFELGEVIKLSNNEIGAVNNYNLAIASISRSAKFADIWAYNDALMGEIGKAYKLEKSLETCFIKGRGADVYYSNKKIGSFGEINPVVLENFNIDLPVVGYEINLEELIKI